MTVCNICCRPADKPYHVVGKDGKTIQGCVAACHGKHLFIGAYAHWFNRLEAKKIRSGLKKYGC